MAQVTIDTNNDTLEDLEATARIIEQAIARRKGTMQATTRAPDIEQAEDEKRLDMPAAPQEETALDTPFLKITVKEVPDKGPDERPAKQAPSLNQLINDERLSEDELSKMFKEVSKNDEEKENAERPKKKEKSDDQPYIEIIDYEEEK